MSGQVRVVLLSHDGQGLGHVRRNCRIAEALAQREPQARITVVTGVTSRHTWLDGGGGAPARHAVVRVPSMVKDATGRYRHPSGSTAQAHRRRSELAAGVIAQERPHLVLVDRHPLGIADEWAAGLAVARRLGSAVVLGLRDVLDEPDAVRAELAGASWQAARGLLDDVVVYGQRQLCDHRREYALPARPRYLGVVTGEVAAGSRHTPGLLVVTAGGGADGAELTRLADALSSHPRVRRTVLVAGPAARAVWPGPGVELADSAPDCTAWYAAAAASVQMAGYNSTYEALAAGLRPILVPRRRPRREQAIRASRLAALGLADVVDEGAHPAEVAWLLDRPRRLTPAQLAAAGLTLDGADRVAEHLLRVAATATVAA